MDDQQRVFVAVDPEHLDVALIMVGVLDSNGQPTEDAHVVEATVPTAANIVGRFIARRRGLEFIPRATPAEA